MLSNSLVKGWVRHRRYEPRPHQFDYDMKWTLLDLDNVEEQFSQSRLWSIEKAGLVSYRAKDFHQGPRSNPSEKYPKATKQNIINSIMQQKGKEFSGKVYMMSHLRNYGYNFNSVCFYYCFNTDQNLAYIISEITNTPWGERHSYIFDCADDNEVQKSNIYQFSFSKEFHVSPFIQMDMLYRWTFKLSEGELRVHMAVLTTEGKKYFDATFTGQLLPLNKTSMNKYVFSHALQPHKMSFLIYWQAFKLWLKRFKVFDHPKHRQS
ncbi:DUF1365 domain-containing protein [Kangiella sp. HD9-110m-PIT-SAG07]|nr:DUF1365 domain-containing protein [Kangiella sp. HD9-110m-PIT-SAG07]